MSWVKRRGDHLNLITFGRHTYSSDSRYSLVLEPPNNWQLQIQYSNARDEGIYECQVSLHPPMVLLVYLTVVGKYKYDVANPFIQFIHSLVELIYEPLCGPRAI